MEETTGESWVVWFGWVAWFDLDYEYDTQLCVMLLFMI